MPFNSVLKDEMFLSTFALLIALIVLHASCFEKLFSLFCKKKPREFASNLIASQVIGIKTWSPGKWRDRIFVQSGQVQTISRVRFAKVSSFDLKVSDDQASKGKLI